MADAILKRCTKCSLERTIDQFSKDSQKKDGKRPICKICDGNRQRESGYAASRAWRRRHPDQVRAYKRAYYDANERSPHPPKDLTAPTRAKRAWKARNPSAVREDRTRRRATEEGRIPAWADRAGMRNYYVISRFLSEAFGVKFHVDHLVPLRSDVVCGLHVSSNLTWMPAAWNQSKNNKRWPDMWESAQEWVRFAA